MATLGTVSAPVIAAVGLGPVPTDGDGASPTGHPAKGRRVRGALARRRGEGRVGAARARRRRVAAGLRAIAEGALLGPTVSPATRPSRSRAGVTRSRPSRCTSPDAADKTAKAEVKRAAVLAAAVARTRDWINTAPNDLRPPTFADEVAEAAHRGRARRRGARREGAPKGGYGGILAVGMGSEAPPRLVRITYAPAGGASRNVSRSSARASRSTPAVRGQARRRACGR